MPDLGDYLGAYLDALSAGEHEKAAAIRDLALQAAHGQSEHDQGFGAPHPEKDTAVKAGLSEFIRRRLGGAK